MEIKEGDYRQRQRNSPPDKAQSTSHHIEHDTQIVNASTVTTQLTAQLVHSIKPYHDAPGSKHLNDAHRYSTTTNQASHHQRHTPWVRLKTMKRRRTSRHCSPQWSLIGPSIPNATPLNHQNENTIELVQTPKTIHFVRSLSRREENTKWSIRWASMRTEK